LEWRESSYYKGVDLGKKVAPLKPKIHLPRSLASFFEHKQVELCATWSGGSQATTRELILERRLPL
jgi:hypothetical protein